ncbi:hypothetical protein BJ994_000509 [Arthrobacter pigmenti]|uniref:NERD domain-containing protein n=1 Tax=Arthrobacter pigmenti TaxID=271432 RepID=A0A846REH8_9MICC|nr:nuclease-related domain-containing protein [Arthrobacter pigmenti]NJC21433.1 hypothetical protein [Arthrobacter pigmenti]
MAAGEGASDRARQAGERVERLRQQLQQAERAQRAWEAGALGEALVAERLRELEDDGWFFLHDVHWPGRPKANLDHIAIGPGGVVVIDAKNWTGIVQLHHGELRQNGYRRTSTVDSVLEQAGAVAVLLEPQHRQSVSGWLCLVGQPELRGTTKNGVRIQGLNGLSDALRTLPPVLDATTVRAIRGYLEQLLGGSRSPGLWTTAQLAATNKNDAASSTLTTRRTASRAQPVRQHSTRRRTRKHLSVTGAVIRLSLVAIGIVVLLNIYQGL